MRADGNTAEKADMRPYLDDLVALYGVFFILAAVNWAEEQIRKAEADS